VPNLLIRPYADKTSVVGVSEASPWREEGGALVRDLRFGDFRAALAFVNRVGAIAEEQGHHPDVLLHGYRHVRLTLSTHSAGRVTEADHALARAIDDLVAR
jgi:4a-hydroxytetrahydrobiopterin dehydratase